MKTISFVPLYREKALFLLFSSSYRTVETEMDRFEEFGRRIDEELARLRQYLEQEVAPETERRTASFLREAARKLEEAAAKVEARIAGRRP